MIDNGIFSFAHPALISLCVLLFSVINSFVEAQIIKRHIKLTDLFHNLKIIALILLASVLWLKTSVFLHITEIPVAMAANWLFFDLFLNLFRGLPWYYVPVKPESEFDEHIGLKFNDPKFYVMVKFFIWLGLSMLSTYLIGFVYA